jgi:DNA-binding GntR family transcriptional regulator
MAIASDLALSQQIANSLKNEILAGLYPPGARIRQEEIAAQFGASRSPVREALLILESEGLINLIAHTGAWVADLSLEECEEMYQLRERIEPLMIRLSIPTIDEKTIAKLTELTVAMEKNKDVEEFLRLDREFHLLTYSGADTLLIGDMVNRLWNTTQHYRRAYSQLLAADSFKPAHVEHFLILEAVKKRDAEAAERILYGHIRRTRLELSAHPDLFTHVAE